MKRRYSLYKTITWRIIATIITATIAYLITGKFEIAASIGLLDAAIKMIGYYCHERVWERYVFKRT